MRYILFYFVFCYFCYFNGFILYIYIECIFFIVSKIYLIYYRLCFEIVNIFYSYNNCINDNYMIKKHWNIAFRRSEFIGFIV